MLLALLECLGIWFVISIPASLLIATMLARRDEPYAVRLSRAPLPKPKLSGGEAPAVQASDVN
jgi:hypothetical protein